MDFKVPQINNLEKTTLCSITAKKEGRHYLTINGRYVHDLGHYLEVNDVVEIVREDYVVTIPEDGTYVLKDGVMTLVKEN